LGYIIYADGRKYFGQFINDIKAGEGHYISNGDYYLGKFSRD